jgi:hypothetical protein
LQTLLVAFLFYAVLLTVERVGQGADNLYNMLWCSETSSSCRMDNLSAVSALFQMDSKHE